MTARSDLERQLDAFLQDGPSELPEPSFFAVRDRIESTRQRVFIGPWRLPVMNRLVPTGLAVAALVVAVAIGTQLVGPAAPTSVGAPPSARPSSPSSPSAGPAGAAPTPAGSGGLAAGAFQVSDGPVAITVDIPTSGWVHLIEFDALSKADDGLDPPKTTGALMLAWSFTDPIVVYGHPCQWSTTTPGAPVTTADEFASALAAQAVTDATAPEDVTIGGYGGKHLTMRVPDGPVTREEAFKDCDQGIFGTYGIVGDAEPARNALGSGQIDELWLLDVDGAIVIIDAMYGPAVPAELIDEMRSIAGSATLQVP